MAPLHTASLSLLFVITATSSVVAQTLNYTSSTRYHRYEEIVFTDPLNNEFDTFGYHHSGSNTYGLFDSSDSILSGASSQTSSFQSHGGSAVTEATFTGDFSTTVTKQAASYFSTHFESPSIQDLVINLENQDVSPGGFFTSFQFYENNTLIYNHFIAEGATENETIVHTLNPGDPYRLVVSTSLNGNWGGAKANVTWAVPEPSSALLSFLGLGFLTRRNRK